MTKEIFAQKWLSRFHTHFPTDYTAATVDLLVDFQKQAKELNLFKHHFSLRASDATAWPPVHVSPFRAAEHLQILVDARAKLPGALNSEALPQFARDWNEQNPYLDASDGTNEAMSKRIAEVKRAGWWETKSVEFDESAFVEVLMAKVQELMRTEGITNPGELQGARYQQLVEEAAMAVAEGKTTFRKAFKKTK